MYTPGLFEVSEEAAWAYLSQRAFGTVVAVSGGTPVASHVPLEVSSRADRRISFHLARANPLHGILAAHPRALIVVSGPDAYVSPDWYATRHQVPTWNYMSVHLTGEAEILPAAEALAHVDSLTRQFESRLAGKKPWTSDKLPAAKREAMLRAIVPVAFSVERIEAQWKLSQNKSLADQEGVLKMLEWRGDWPSLALAEAMRRRLREPAPAERRSRERETAS
jgi:transcriptional regulator